MIFNKLLADQRGAGALEYSALLVLICISALPSINSLNGRISAPLNTVTENLSLSTAGSAPNFLLLAGATPPAPMSFGGGGTVTSNPDGRPLCKAGRPCVSLPTTD